MKYDIPSPFLWYCRTCQVSTPHAAKGKTANCLICGRKTHAVEILAVFATDEFETPPRVMLPQGIGNPENPAMGKLEIAENQNSEV